MNIAGPGMARMAAAVAGGLVLLSSCGGEEPGTPTAAETTTTTTSTPPPSEPSTSPSPTESGPSLEAMDPCELLTDAERTAVGLDSEEPDTDRSTPRCVWSLSGSGVVSVTLWPDYGFADLSPGDVTSTDVTIGGHQGRRLEHNTATICDYDISVADSSTVTVSSTHDEVDAACELAEQVATLIEPKLPEDEG